MSSPTPRLTAKRVEMARAVAAGTVTTRRGVHWFRNGEPALGQDGRALRELLAAELIEFARPPIGSVTRTQVTLTDAGRVALSEQPDSGEVESEPVTSTNGA